MNFTLDIDNLALYSLFLVGMMSGSFLAVLSIEIKGEISLTVAFLSLPFIALRKGIIMLLTWVERHTSIWAWITFLIAGKYRNLSKEIIEFSGLHYIASEEFNPIRKFMVRKLIKAIDRKNNGKILDFVWAELALEDKRSSK